MKLGKYIVIEKKELVNAVIQYAAWLTYFTISNKYDSLKKIALALTYTAYFLYGIQFGLITID